MKYNLGFGYSLVFSPYLRIKKDWKFSNAHFLKMENKRTYEEELTTAKRSCGDSTDAKEEIEPIFKRKLRKYVLLLSYCGKGYFGMQRNPGFQTIEDTLLMAMLKSSLISEDVVTCPQINKFQRAARTDKGVSAARQVVSIKLPEYDSIPEMINEHLPPVIKVMKAVRVTQKFDAKNRCDSRTYSYMTPTFAFAPLNELTNNSYRISSEVLLEVRTILRTYIGTHNFHNFTARMKANDPSAKRFIMDISCSDPFVYNDLEWVRIKIKGQSFMLHQIRKMIGLTMAICRGFVGKDIFDSVWKPRRRDIPIAPGLGLVLEEPHYDYYNKKFRDDGVHEQLNWDSIEKEIQNFRETYIDKVIVETEISEQVTLNWLKTLFLHTFDAREHSDATSLQQLQLVKKREIANDATLEDLSENNERNPSFDENNISTSDCVSPVSLIAKSPSKSEEISQS